MTSPTERGFSTVMLKDSVKKQFDQHRGKVSASDALTGLLDAAGAVPTTPSPVDWDGLRLELKRRLKLGSTAVLDDVLREYGMPSE